MLDRLIPYAGDAYQAMFAFYYLDTSPAHLLALPIGFFIVVSLARHSKRGPTATQFIIAAFWVWTGAIFHSQYFVDLNWAAEYFGYVFIGQGVLIAMHTYINRDQVYFPEARTRVIGCSLVILGMALSPTIAAIMETPISHAHLFGITPLSLIIATMGIFTVTFARTPLWLLAIPVIWAVWDALSAQTLGLWQDFTLAIVALTAIVGSTAYKRFFRH